MIQLNADFTLLNSYFDIAPHKILQYANKDIEEIMKLEAQAGNEKAQNYKEILSNPEKLQEIFKLSNIENKFIILQNMSEEDLDKLLPFLSIEQLALGLNFFNDEKLLAMCNELPKEELICMMFEEFKLIDILVLMEDSAMDVFLKNGEVERKYAQNYFENLKDEELKQLMIQIQGIEVKDKSRDEHIKDLRKMNDLDFQNFLLSFDKENKINLIDGIVSQEDDLLTLFNSKDLTRPMTLLLKADKIKLMSNLEKEFLTPMLEELPTELEQIVLTQIDPKIFSEILAKDFQDILSSVVLFSTK